MRRTQTKRFPENEHAADTDKDVSPCKNSNAMKKNIDTRDGTRRMLALSNVCARLKLGRTSRQISTRRSHRRARTASRRRTRTTNRNITPCEDRQYKSTTSEMHKAATHRMLALHANVVNRKSPRTNRKSQSHQILKVHDALRRTAAQVTRSAMHKAATRRMLAWHANVVNPKTCDRTFSAPRSTYLQQSTQRSVR